MYSKFSAQWNLPFLILVLILISCGQLGSANSPRPFNATASTMERQIKFVYAKIGEPVNLQWNSNQNQAIEYCRWDRINPGSQKSFVINSLTSATPKGYSIDKFGLHHGHCRLTIADVKYVDLTVWHCALMDKETRHDGLAVGAVNLTGLVKPSSPKLNADKLENFVDSNGTNSVNISCCANGGRPSPKLTIALNDKVLNETLNYDHLNNSLTSGQNVCLNITNVRLNWTHNGKNLACFADHPGYKGSDQKMDSIVLNIFHEPKILSPIGKENESTFTMSKLKDTRVFIEFVANPFPEVHWLMKGPEGQYEDLPMDIGHLLVQNLTNRSWQAELTNPSDLTKSTSFLLTIKNRYGYKEIDIYIKIRPDASWGWIVIYVSGILAFLIIAGFLILILLKRKGWLCFRVRKSRNYGFPDEQDEPEVPLRVDEYELNPTLIRTKETVRTREGTVYVPPSTNI